MESPGRLRSSRDKKIKRKEVLAKQRAIDEIIKTAYADKDHLSSFLPFCNYERDGLSVYLESGFGETLSSSMKQYIQNLLKGNMEVAYGPDWQTEEKVKCKEMVAPEARYIIVREAPHAKVDEVSSAEGEMTSTRWMGDGDTVVGFVHYRFIVEEDIPVLYVYELQLEYHVRRRGLGKRLMQLIELIARKNRMGAVMLTVQKANVSAMNFYRIKLRYVISSISPSRVDPLRGLDKNYEILCKTSDGEAKAKLEDANNET
ncbi:hypothetical protein QJS10_CPB12g01605 [Acorus calamus]|uniref:N-alpha-acetyltransferase 40 n=1 Tax=Acorus calamus TaxID=4465 RepID=A0AAV9DQ75_ACOCL|nr:hypothetical protein QJS10_CPB12g01605 [Acorus calamus]